MNKEWKIPEPKEIHVDGKVYSINGKKYVRVTHSLSIISKNGLFGWYMSVGKRKAEAIIKKRQVLGTKVHSIFEHMLKGDYKEENGLEPEIEEDIKLFKFLKYNCSLKPEALEQRLWNDEYGYAGTADYIGRYTTHKPYVVRGHTVGFDNDLVIIDWKTSRDIYDDYWLQLAAYAYAFWKLTGVKVKGAVIAQFRLGKIRIKEKNWDELMKLFEVYKSVLTVYRWKHKM